jgi:hypothetical protein
MWRLSRNPENINRLLASLDAIFRAQPQRRLGPSAGHLSGGGHLNLLTSGGPLDLLGTVGRDLRAVLPVLRQTLRLRDQANES